MKNKLITNIGAIALISTTLLALSGPHGNLATGAGGDNGEICVYCHTPHAANVENGVTPLWNKPTSALVTQMGNSYPMYGTTMAGTTTTSQPQDQTLACLSCHDGVSAMNSVVNAPGSGSASIYGSQIIGNNSLNNKVMTESSFTVGKVVAGNPGLANDHPISIVYTPGKASLRPVETPLQPYINATGTHQWIGAKLISDLLKGPDKNMVHCTSCHDPHTNENETYLRVSNNSSSLCYGCHDK